jgi:DNA-binding MarR family transcriptional regulator
MASRRQRIVDRILALEAQMHRAVGYADPVAWLGAELTMTQVKVLFVLLVAGPLSLGELARMMQVKMATGSGVVDRLVTAGLVSRAPDPGDRRYLRLGLTEDGRALAYRLHEDSRMRTARLLEVMTVAELEQVFAAMKVMISASERLYQAQEDPS